MVETALPLTTATIAVSDKFDVMAKYLSIVPILYLYLEIRLTSILGLHWAT